MEFETLLDQVLHPISKMNNYPSSVTVLSRAATAERRRPSSTGT
jgi:hypothetical protein